jgi:CysZ protein
MAEPTHPSAQASPAPKPPGRGLGALIAGAIYPLRAIALLQRHPHLRAYVVYPILINILLFITLYVSLLYGGLWLIDWVIEKIPTWTAQSSTWVTHLPHPSTEILSPALTDSLLPSALSRPDWLPTWPDWHLPLPHWRWSTPDWLDRMLAWRPTLPGWVSQIPGWGAIALLWLLRVVLTLILLGITGFIFLQFGVLLGSPWYGKLSEELEKLRTGQVLIIDVGLVGDIGRALLFELKKLGLMLGLGLPLFAVKFLPGIGTLVGIIGSITLATTIVCLDFLDAPLERRRLRFRDKLKVVGGSLPASASFGLVCLGLVSIPFVNLLAIPVCVTAGTLFVCDRVLPEWVEKP